jgi:hypothetical protein
LSGAIFYDNDGIEIRIKYDGSTDKNPHKVRITVFDEDSVNYCTHYFDTVGELDEVINALKKARDEFWFEERRLAQEPS